MLVIGLIVGIIFVGVLKTIQVNMKQNKTKTKLDDILMDACVVYHSPFLNTIYVDDKRVLKFEGKKFFKETAVDGSYEYITLTGKHEIKVIPVWDSKKRKLGSDIFHYLPKRVSLEVKLLKSVEYMLLVSDVLNNEPSSHCHVNVIYENDKHKIAFMLVPFDEYVEKYYNSSVF